MATLSSHLLDSTNGTHASGVKVLVYQINSSGEKKLFLETITDEGGRILKDMELTPDDCKCNYEMVCEIGEYFKKKKVVSEIVIKFKMINNKRNYHLPIIISPNSYTVWWSK